MDPAPKLRFVVAAPVWSKAWRPTLSVFAMEPPAEWIEHHLGAAVRERIAAEVGLRGSDPHGRAIPPER